jgi:hypothetical protein
MKPDKPKREPKQRRRPAVPPDEDDDREFERSTPSIPKPHQLPGLQPQPVLRLC